MRHFLFAALFAALFSTPAFAACTAPAGAESQTRYDFGTHRMYYCNNSQWVEMGANPLTALGCLTGQVPVKTAGGWGCADLSETPATGPDPFSFTDQTGAATGTQVTSNTLTITGLSASTPVSVTGQGSPQISINGGAWTTSGTITNNQTLRVRLTSSANPGTAHAANVTVGGVSDAWSVATAAAPPSPPCNLPGGGTISVGGTIAMFPNRAYGCSEACEYQLRTCQSDGTLSGSSVYSERNCNRSYSCAAVTVGGYKWYLGQKGQSCDQVCASHGGCNLTGIRSYAGSGAGSGAIATPC